MSSNVFNTVYQIVYEKLKNKGFEFEKNEDQALFYNQKFYYRMKLMLEEKTIILEYCLNEEQSIYEWNTASSWLLNDNDTSSKYLSMIAEDFLDSVLDFKKEIKKQPTGKNSYTERGKDGLFFANRFVNIFPDLKEKIFIEKECYSEFRGTVFTKDSILPKIQRLLAEGKDDKKIEKLSKLIDDLYKNSSLNIRSLITMGILNNINNDKNVDLIKKYIGKNLNDAWELSVKYKNKKFKPEKVKSSKNLLSNVLSNQ